MKQQYTTEHGKYLTRLADFIHSLNNVEKVEILPYHTMGIYKWKELGLDYPLEGINPPTKERVENAKKILAEGGEFLAAWVWASKCQNRTEKV